MTTIRPSMARLIEALPTGYTIKPGVMDFAMFYRGEPILRFDDSEALETFLRRYAAAAPSTTSEGPKEVPKE